MPAINPFAEENLAPQAANNAAAPVNPFSEQALQESERTILRGALMGGQRANADQTAQAVKLSRITGSPYEAIRDNLQEVEDSVKLDDYEKMLARAPSSRRFLTSRQNAEMSSDDVGGLTGIEQAIRSMGGAAVDVAKYVVSAPGAMGGGLFREAGTVAAQVGMGATAGVGAGLFDLGGVVNDVIGKPLQALGQPDHYNPFISMGNSARGQAERTRAAMQSFTPESDTNIGKGFYSGLQSLGTNLAILPAGVASGSGSVVAGLMSAVAGAKAYTDARVKGIEPIGAATYAAPTAAFEYAFEKVPASRLLSDLAKGSTLWKTFTNQLVPEILGEQATTVLQDMNEWIRLNPTKTLREFVAERPDAAIQTLVATIVGVAGQSAVVRAVSKLSGTRDQSAQAEQAATTAQTLSQLVQASKLRARDPEAFAAFVNQVAEDGDAPTELYINADILTSSLNQAGVTMERLAMVAPGVAQQLRAASFVPGSDIRVPVAEFAAAGPDITTPLIDHLRSSPDAMSRLEAQDYLNNEGDRIRGDVEQELGKMGNRTAYEQGITAIQSQFEAQLNAAGKFRPEVNTAYAGLLGNFYSAQAARAGMTPQELLDRYQLRVTGKDVRGAQTLEQRAKTEETTGLVTPETSGFAYKSPQYLQYKALFGEATRLRKSAAAMQKTGDVGKNYTAMADSAVAEAQDYFNGQKQQSTQESSDNQGADAIKSASNLESQRIRQEALTELRERESVIQAFIRCMGG